MRVIDRRLFLNESALLAITAAILGQSAPATAQRVAAKKAGDKLRVAVIGVGGRGKDHLKGFAGRHNCEVTVVCDADKANARGAIEIVKAKQGNEPRFEQDVRKVVADKEIDVISIATPNHWHALMAIWGLQNGKHVYVEKPVSHNVVEGRRIVDFAHGKNLICQTGTQSRSTKGMSEAMAFLRSGKLGKVEVAKGLCYKLRGSIGLTRGPQKVPGTVNYDLWCGPASNAPLRRKRLHYDWHWVWEYGNGDLGNQGIHEMDKARWGLGKNTLPNSVQSIGGRFGYVDDGQTANTQIIHFDYGDSALVFEVRGLPSESPYPGSRSPMTVAGKKQNFVGNIFYCTNGFLVCPSYTGGIAYSKDGEVIKEFGGGGDHYGNFVAAIRAGKRELLNAEILQGHLSSAMCHLGNISYRLGTNAAFDPKAAPFGNKAADNAFGSVIKHLSDNGVKVEETKFSKGPRLKLDPKTERFVGPGPDDTKANKMLAREEYRKGFELPDATKG